MAIERRSPNWKRVSRTHRVDLGGLFERINVDHSICIKYVNTTEQLAHNLTLGASTTILVKSLMRLVDIDPTTKLHFNRSISESSCSAVSKSDVHEPVESDTYGIFSKAKNEDRSAESQASTAEQFTKLCHFHASTDNDDQPDVDEAGDDDTDETITKPRSIELVMLQVSRSKSKAMPR